MKGPITLIRSESIAGYKNLDPIYEWDEGKAYVIIDRIAYGGKTGAVFCYYNPPVHQVGNPALDAFLIGLDNVLAKKKDLDFLLFCGPNDPVHAGGDLKESLTRLDMTLEVKREKETSGASAEEIETLYEWADSRINKGTILHGKIRDIAQSLRVVALCGGGTRFGGSAEIPLMADYLVGDSRSAMCFSEAMIGLIPGWSGVARALVKTGLINTLYMAQTSSVVQATQLKEIGIYNRVVEIPFSFPKIKKSDNPDADRTAYREALLQHDHETGLLLLPEGLEMATCPRENISLLGTGERSELISGRDLEKEVERRTNPENYTHLWGKPLREVGNEISKSGRPLAPQSIEALQALFQDYDPSTFHEKTFVEREAHEDARLYRDSRFRRGLVATLEQKVADFSEES